MAEMDTGSMELFSEYDEDTNGEDVYSSESDDGEDEPPTVPNSAPSFSKKQPQLGSYPRSFSEKRHESSRRSRADTGYYEEWLKLSRQ